MSCSPIWQCAAMKRAAWRILAALAVFLAGCTTNEMSRNVYEGIKARDEIQRPPTDAPRPPTPSYEQYDKERRSLSAPRKE